MDLFEFESSEEKQQIDNYSSAGGSRTGGQTLSTDHDRTQSEIKKSKIIKKSYQPIRDGNIVVRYEDDPVQYKRLRKKIQNRQSAARVRGRKKGTMQCLEVQVEQLKKVNSQLLLKNASLQSENKSLKNQVQFLRQIVKPNKKSQKNDHNFPDPIDQYLNLSPKGKNSEMKPQQHYESPFQQEDSALNWIRSSGSMGARSNWSTLFVLTIVVCAFIIPQDSNTNQSIVAQQTGETIISERNFILQIFWSYLKISLKYLILMAYVFFVGSFVYGKYYNKKYKKNLKLI